MTAKTLDWTCPDCKKVLTATRPENLKRAIGTHRRMVHDIAGMTKEDKRIKAREDYWKKIGLSPEEIARKREKYKELAAIAPEIDPTLDAKRERQRVWAARKRAQRNGDSEDIKLVFVCPCCFARIYAKKGGD